MMHADYRTDPNTHIFQVTKVIIWGSIFLCGFINLVLLGHVAFYAIGALSIMSLVGFFTLATQFHAACLILSIGAILMCIAYTHIDRKLT
tara:strand:+ start:38 stop:307 length:270 start_codon:yes stop_codon:yes gene_type:complete